jgi:uncharacterized surface protein with fasciclin (FAS1) repeats
LITIELYAARLRSLTKKQILIKRRLFRDWRGLQVAAKSFADHDNRFIQNTARATRSSLRSRMPNIVEVAVAAGSFKTLVAAVTAAGLGETLSGPGPFTVFAPTDEAFAKLPAGTVEGLLKDIPALTKILTYHVVSGKVMAAEAAKLTSAKTVQGGDIKIDASNGVKINDATVVTADVDASNGVIHAIDTVLMPA